MAVTPARRALTRGKSRDSVNSMIRMGIAITTALAVGSLLGCQKAGSDELSEKLDQIDKRLASMEKKLDKVGTGAARPQQKRPPGPDPAKVYAAPIAGAAFVGPEHAKVTIVDAMEFA